MFLKTGSGIGIPEVVLSLSIVDRGDVRRLDLELLRVVQTFPTRDEVVETLTLVSATSLVSQHLVPTSSLGPKVDYIMLPLFCAVILHLERLKVLRVCHSYMFRPWHGHHPVTAQAHLRYHHCPNELINEMARGSK
jgi:hypothetical protein